MVESRIRRRDLISCRLAPKSSIRLDAQSYLLFNVGLGAQVNHLQFDL
jgi:hypothetical protein